MILQNLKRLILVLLYMDHTVFIGSEFMIVYWNLHEYVLIERGKRVKKTYSPTLLTDKKSSLCPENNSFQNNCCISQCQIPLHILIWKWSYKLEDISTGISEVGSWVRIRCLQNNNKKTIWRRLNLKRKHEEKGFISKLIVPQLYTD